MNYYSQYIDNRNNYMRLKTLHIDKQVGGTKGENRHLERGRIMRSLSRNKASKPKKLSKIRSKADKIFSKGKKKYRRLSREGVPKRKTVSTKLVNVENETNQALINDLNVALGVFELFGNQIGGDNIFKKLYEHYRDNDEFINWSLTFHPNNCQIVDRDPQLSEKINGNESFIYTIMASDSYMDYMYDLTSILAVIGMKTKDDKIVIGLKRHEIKHGSKTYDIVGTIKKHPELNDPKNGFLIKDDKMWLTFGPDSISELFYMMIFGYLMKAKGYLVIENSGETWLEVYILVLDIEKQ